MDDDDFYDDDETMEYDCGAIEPGNCALAGTEWCDWECPLHNEIFAVRLEKTKP